MLTISEKQFEADIEASLLSAGGYEKGNPSAFDRHLALDKETFIDFIKISQPKKWARLEKIYKEDTAKNLIDRFDKVVQKKGLLEVFRRGFEDRGITFNAVFWKPETDMNQTALMQYCANVLHCTRQLRYSPKNENSIDIVLFVNGIPVVSMELKNQFTGQDVGNAINQYKFDRAGKEKIFAFKERVLVHFAVDLTEVHMTTRLMGKDTYFLPFNQGTGGAGNVGGKGNPANPDGYMTAYLWERILEKDNLLEMLHRYIHVEVQKDEKGNVKSETVIFPRYHQYDVVTKLLADVKANGAGHNYLIQHSAGSGKSNSIAWLAHRLSGLHDADNEKIFQSVIIVTDRRVLDRQLQDTVQQFEQVKGLIKKIDKDSQQLKQAIEDGTGVIVTTLQKFPVIYKEVDAGTKRYAIIVDEAHSSQTGDAAKKLKGALANTEEVLKEYAEIEELEEEQRKDEEDRILQELSEQGQHGNLSFFAFTATPKDKTLSVFGQKQPDGSYAPYHVYSMRQAIEEGFILDVLQNYMTYQMYYKIAKDIKDDPELETTAALRAIRKYESLHPHNISQKTAIMIEHFREVTKKKIGGKAKAMVVTPSRLHAVRYWKEFKDQIKSKGYQDIDVLVAFSGEVVDGGASFTEEKLNIDKAGNVVREGALPEVFNSDDFNILIVAEKYQTGFDEPLLHTMFVNKKLRGVKAVQTLSRLNRTKRGKDDTFVLDFVNSTDDIRNAFQPFYQETQLTEGTDPNVVYDYRYTLEEYRLWSQDDIDAFADIYYELEKAGALGEDDGQAMGRLVNTLKPALDAFNLLTDEQKQVFRTTLARFNRIYSFVTQVCRLFDKGIHKFSQYARFLAKILPRNNGAVIDLTGQISLVYYKLKETFKGSVELEDKDGEYKPISGQGGAQEKTKDPLSVLVDTINKEFQTDFTEMDKVLKQIENDMAAQPQWYDYANNNDPKTFRMLFDKAFPKMAADRYKQNDEFFVKMFQTEKMMEMVMDGICSSLYSRLRNDPQMDLGM